MARLKAPALASEVAFRAMISEIAQIQNQLAVIVAKRDGAIQRILSVYAARTEPLEAAIKGRLSLVGKYADENRTALLPKDKKSADTALAVFGWRTGNRTVKQLNKSWTEEKIITALDEADLTDYIREVREIAKDKILADCEDNATLASPDYVFPGSEKVAISGDKIPLADVGLKITQTETFYVEPKAESADTLKAPEASAA